MTVLDDAGEAPAFPMERRPFDPPPDYDRLRTDDPICRVRLWDGSHAWLVTRYDDVRALLSDPRVSADASQPGYPSASAGVAGLDEPTFKTMDPPEHTAYRRMLTMEFTAKKMDAKRGQFQAIVDGLIDAMLAAGPPCDLVSAFALPVPSLVICDLLGVPYEDHEFFERNSAARLSLTSTPEESRGATANLLGYLTGLVERRLDEPGDDLVSRLVQDHVVTGAISIAEASAMVRLLLSGGHETTANMIALGTVTLLQHPAQLDRLRADPGRWRPAIEELLRYLTIAQFSERRVAADDVVIGTTTIPKGDGIFALSFAANRDPDAFDAPHRFDIDRKANNHVAFGFGAHQCLGQAMARVELHVVFETLFRRIPTLRLDADVDGLPYKTDHMFYGVYSLPVTWDGGER